jgi:hypothetical protein
MASFATTGLGKLTVVQGSWTKASVHDGCAEKSKEQARFVGELEALRKTNFSKLEKQLTKNARNGYQSRLAASLCRIDNLADQL